MSKCTRKDEKRLLDSIDLAIGLAKEKREKAIVRALKTLKRDLQAYFKANDMHEAQLVAEEALDEIHGVNVLLSSFLRDFTPSQVVS